MSVSSNESLSIQEFASLFGFPPETVAAAVETQRQRRSDAQAFYTIPQLAERWSCSRAQVYNLLRAAAAKVINVGQGKKRSKTLVPADVVLRLEKNLTEKMS